MANKESYKDRIKSSSKKAIGQLLLKLQEPLDSELEDKQMKQVISGRLEIIAAIRKMLVNLSKDKTVDSWIKEKLPLFKDGIESTFDVLEDLLGKDIEEDDASKYAVIAKSKIEASNFLEEIIDAIKDIEEKIEKGEVKLEDTTFKSSIEQFAMD